MPILIFITGLIWGSLAAQFFVQTLLSLAIACLHVAGFVFSSIPKSNNATGAGVALFQTILFGTLFVGGNFLTNGFIDYDTWNAMSIGSLITFLLTVAYVAPQARDKLMLARMSSWDDDARAAIEPPGPQPEPGIERAADGERQSLPRVDSSSDAQKARLLQNRQRAQELLKSRDPIVRAHAKQALDHAEVALGLLERMKPDPAGFLDGRARQ
jgi:hypothetical protein